MGHLWGWRGGAPWWSEAGPGRGPAPASGPGPAGGSSAAARSRCARGPSLRTKDTGVSAQEAAALWGGWRRGGRTGAVVRPLLDWDAPAGDGARGRRTRAGSVSRAGGGAAEPSRWPAGFRVPHRPPTATPHWPRGGRTPWRRLGAGREGLAGPRGRLSPAQAAERFWPEPQAPTAGAGPSSPAPCSRDRGQLGPGRLSRPRELPAGCPVKPPPALLPATAPRGAQAPRPLERGATAGRGRRGSPHRQTGRTTPTARV